MPGKNSFFTIHCTMTKQLYRKLHREMISRARVKSFYFKAALVIPMGLGGIFPALPNGNFWLLALHLLQVAVAAALAIGFSVSYNGNYGKYARQYLGPACDLSVTFGEVISTSGGDKILTFPYSSLQCFSENESAFYLYMGHDLLLLPKSSFSAEEIVDFRLFLTPRQEFRTPARQRKRRLLQTCITALLLASLLLMVAEGNLTSRSDRGAETISEALSRRFGDQYQIISLFPYPQGMVAFVYGGDGSLYQLAFDYQGEDFDFVDGAGYKLEEIASYSESSSSPFFSQPLTYGGQEIRYCCVYADSLWISWLDDMDLTVQPFTVGNQDYILYIYFNPKEAAVYAEHF